MVEKVEAAKQLFLLGSVTMKALTKLEEDPHNLISKNWLRNHPIWRNPYPYCSPYDLGW
jgi:hypothetical protein